MGRDSTRMQNQPARVDSGSRVSDRDLEHDIGSEREGFGGGSPPSGEMSRNEESADGFGDRVGRRAKQVFSPRVFIGALLVTVTGLIVGSMFVPLPGAGLLGVFVATFLVGLAREERRYLEAALAGGITVGVSVLVDLVVLAFIGGLGVSLALLGGLVGGVIGLAGAYFGRDLRDGLTRDI